MEFEEMKRIWNDSFSRLDSQQQTEILTSVQSSRRSTALQDLSKRYLRFACLSGVMTVLSLAYFTSALIPESMRYTTGIAFAVYFCIACVMDLYLYREVSSINLAADTVDSVIRQSIRCRKLHLTFILILLPLAFSMIGLLIYTFDAERYMVLGIIAGFIVGALMGIRQFRKFMAEYKELI